jgi:DUF1365 family protein
MVYMRHRRFLPKKHRYQHPSMNLYLDKQEESKTDELERIGYRQKVFDMVKGINIEFEKKKKEEDGPKKPRKKRKRDAAEEEVEPAPASIPFKKQSCFYKFLSY